MHGQEKTPDRSGESGLRSAASDSIQTANLRVPEAEAFIDAVFENRVVSLYDSAAHAYVRILEEGDPRTSDRTRAILRRTIAQMIFLLPAEIRARAIYEKAFGDAAFRDEDEMPLYDRGAAGRGGGEMLARWWRSRDPKPATESNERIIEHLRRVAHAESTFTSDGDPAGFDARGRVYVRFGAPSERVDVRFQTPQMRETIRRLQSAPGNNLIVNSSLFADNTFWFYAHDGELFYFPLVDDGNQYEVAGVDDLLAQNLTTGLNAKTGRGGAKLEIVMEAFRAIYDQLAPYNIELGNRWSEVSNRLRRIDMIRRRRERRERASGQGRTSNDRSDNAAIAAREERRLLQDTEEFVDGLLRQARVREDAIAERRREVLPRQTTATRPAPDLPVDVRTARFLEEDGRTRTEVYWGLRKEGPSSPDTTTDSAHAGDRTIRLTVVRMDSTYRVQERESVERRMREGGRLVARKPVRVAGSRGPYHVHMQWDEMRVRDTASGGASRGTLLRRATVRADTLSPISADPESLAVSDVVPVVLPDGEAVVPRLSEKNGLPGVPIASRTFDSDRPLGLYFEVYHLRFDESNRTRYTIDYTAYRKTDRGALERLFRDAEEVKTSARFTYSGSSRRTQEVLQVGFDRWPDEAEGGTLLLRVEVTDEVTGQEVARSVSFRVGDG